MHEQQAYICSLYPGMCIDGEKGVSAEGRQPLTHRSRDGSDPEASSYDLAARGPDRRRCRCPHAKRATRGV